MTLEIILKFLTICQILRGCLFLSFYNKQITVRYK